MVKEMFRMMRSRMNCTNTLYGCHSGKPIMQLAQQKIGGGMASAPFFLEMLLWIRPLAGVTIARIV